MTLASLLGTSRPDPCPMCGQQRCQDYGDGRPLEERMTQPASDEPTYTVQETTYDPDFGMVTHHAGEVIPLAQAVDEDLPGAKVIAGRVRRRVRVQRVETTDAMPGVSDEVETT